ncbi:MAG TPA: glycoside hydrolase family 2 TIM barrel-domain containing protein [Tepidisphaeraceae bacterium]|nr:glycoside hydrolase family 2 TIM barrel-domain containing protein [Tepidisphaeraceae bacterium]
MSIPRNEYPRPQFARADWLCLNGKWQFEIDPGDSGIDRGLLSRDLSGEIIVPFCPESTLSGIGHVDRMLAVWYRRSITVPATWTGRRVLLHFQACDYETTVWVNGVEVARHRGGFTPFSADVTDHVQPGEPATIVVRARDDWRHPKPMGKQSRSFGNAGCHYTRTTGIWQTAWMEPVAKLHMHRPRITPDVANGAFHMVVPVSGNARGSQVRVTLSDATRPEVKVTATASAAFDFAPQVTLNVPERHRILWEPLKPHLYDLKLELLDGSGTVVDTATSYAGLRSVAIDGMAIKINGKPVFQRLVLDQGYYANGIMTAPSDDDLKRDIELSIAAGFNGARLHQKVFEERFLYHADRFGYLCWGEFPDWGSGGFGPSHDHQRPSTAYVTEWLEALARDYSHPSIIGWCGLNETHQAIHDGMGVLDDVTRAMFLAAKAADPTRPVLDASGYAHRVPETDVYDCHDYEQDPAKFAANQRTLADGRPFENKIGTEKQRQSTPYRGQPFFVSEFGGIWWNPAARPGEDSWGYGQKPATIEEWYARFEGLCDVLLDDPNMFGYCYTQLTDVFQEQNGIYLFDRDVKFDMERVHRIQTKTAAIEKMIV